MVAPKATVVVGYRSGESGRDAVELGLALARVMDGRLVLTHVYRDELDAPELEPGRRLAAAMREVLASAVRDLPDLWTERVSTRLIPDKGHGYSNTLRRVAIEEQAGLLVVGASHLRGARRTLFGTGQKLLYDIPCPLAIAPEGFAQEGQAPLRRIAVGFDGSLASRAALSYAVRLAGDARAEVELISVAQEGKGLALSSIVGERARLATVQRRAIAEHPPNVALRALLLRGDPAWALASHSHEVDLLILGSFGHGALGRLVAGSVSTVLLSESKAPVIVVPAHVALHGPIRGHTQDVAIGQAQGLTAPKVRSDHR